MLLTFLSCVSSQVPSSCPPSSPIGEATITQLLGPGGVGPVSLGSGSFGTVWRACNQVSGCTPNSTDWSQTVAQNSFKYYPVSNRCNTDPLDVQLYLHVVNNIPIVYVSLRSNTNPECNTYIGTGLRTETFSLQNVPADYFSTISSRCVCDAWAEFAPAADGSNPYVPISLHGQITDTCISLFSNEYVLNVGEITYHAIYWYVGTIPAVATSTSASTTAPTTSTSLSTTSIPFTTAPQLSGLSVLNIVLISLGASFFVALFLVLIGCLLCRRKNDPESSKQKSGNEESREMQKSQTEESHPDNFFGTTPLRNRSAREIAALSFGIAALTLAIVGLCGPIIDLIYFNECGSSSCCNTIVSGSFFTFIGGVCFFFFAIFFRAEKPRNDFRVFLIVGSVALFLFLVAVATAQIISSQSFVNLKFPNVNVLFYGFVFGGVFSLLAACALVVMSILILVGPFDTSTNSLARRSCMHPTLVVYVKGLMILICLGLFAVSIVFFLFSIEPMYFLALPLELTGDAFVIFFQLLFFSFGPIWYCGTVSSENSASTAFTVLKIVALSVALIGQLLQLVAGVIYFVSFRNYTHFPWIVFPILFCVALSLCLLMLVAMSTSKSVPIVSLQRHSPKQEGEEIVSLLSDTN